MPVSAGGFRQSRTTSGFRFATMQALAVLGLINRWSQFDLKLPDWTRESICFYAPEE